MKQNLQNVCSLDNNMKTTQFRYNVRHEVDRLSTTSIALHAKSLNNKILFFEINV